MQLARLGPLRLRPTLLGVCLRLALLGPYLRSTARNLPPEKRIPALPLSLGRMLAGGGKARLSSG